MSRTKKFGKGMRLAVDEKRVRQFAHPFLVYISMCRYYNHITKHGQIGEIIKEIHKFIT